MVVMTKKVVRSDRMCLGNLRTGFADGYNMLRQEAGIKPNVATRCAGLSFILLGPPLEEAFRED